MQDTGLPMEADQRSSGASTTALAACSACRPLSPILEKDEATASNFSDQPKSMKLDAVKQPYGDCRYAYVIVQLVPQ